jgi:type VII secretion protein EccB
VQTRRDQLQAYRFVTTRVQSALLHGEPDAAESPMRRIGAAMVSGLMVAVLVTAGFGIFGLLRPGGRQGWKESGTLVVEKETGTRYVYIPQDHALHPALNYASARLILNTATPTVKYFSRRSLAGAPRGLPRGIAGLPDSLPDRTGLVGGPWTVCSQPPAQGPAEGPAQGPADGPTAASLTVSVGYPVAGQRLDAGHALVVSTSADSYLVWNDHQLKITSGSALDALHYSRSWVMRVADTWVNSMPPGPDLRAIRIPGIGGPAPPVAGTAGTVGQVYRVPGSGSVPTQYWVLLPDGLAQTTETNAYLLIADPDTKRAYGAQTPAFVDISSADVSSAQHSGATAVTAGLPATVPLQIDPTASQTPVACSAYSELGGAGNQVAVTLADRVPGGRPQTSVSFGLGPGTASQVALPPGTAAVVQALGGDNQPTGSYYLVTDAGGKYPVPSVEVLGVLGYGDVAVTPVPTGILNLIPTGPALDPATANQEAPVGSNSVTISIPTQQGGGGG